MEYYLPSTRNSEDRTREIEDLLQRFGAGVKSCSGSQYIIDQQNLFAAYLVWISGSKSSFEVFQSFFAAQRCLSLCGAYPFQQITAGNVDFLCQHGSKKFGLIVRAFEIPPVMQRHRNNVIYIAEIIAVQKRC